MTITANPPGGSTMSAQISKTLLSQIQTERAYQVERWGIESDDTVSTPNDFVAYITHHATRWFTGGFLPLTPTAVDTFRTQMIKVAALAIAAVESIDRQRAAEGRTFYEEPGAE